jgi:hypothetical protein
VHAFTKSADTTTKHVPSVRSGPMVTGFAFLATAVASLFAESTFVRWTQRRSAHLAAWAVALAMFAFASAALAVGVSTGWDNGTFRVFYLFGAILNVPWLALGTVALLIGESAARRARWYLVFFSGLAAGVMLSAPMEAVGGFEIPVGKDVFGALPRALAAIGSGVGAAVILTGAVWSVVRLARTGQVTGTPRSAGRLAGANGLIALGTLVLSSGGLVQGFVGHDEAFTISLAVGITVIYAGFLVAEGRRSTNERVTADGASASAAQLPS